MKPEQVPVRQPDIIFERNEKTGRKQLYRAWWRNNLELFLKGLQSIGGIVLRVFSASDEIQVGFVIEELKKAFRLQIIQRMSHGEFSSRMYHPSNADMKKAMGYKNLSLLFEKEKGLACFIDAYRNDANFLVIDDSPQVYMQNSYLHYHVIGIDRFHGDSPMKHPETSALKEVLQVIQEVIRQYRLQDPNDLSRATVRTLLHRVLEERKFDINEDAQQLAIRERSITNSKLKMADSAHKSKTADESKKRKHE